MKLNHNHPMYLDLQSRILSLPQIQKIYQNTFEIFLDQSEQEILILVKASEIYPASLDSDFDNIVGYIDNIYGIENYTIIISPLEDVTNSPECQEVSSGLSHTNHIILTGYLLLIGYDVVEREDEGLINAIHADITVPFNNNPFGDSFDDDTTNINYEDTTPMIMKEVLQYYGRPTI